MLTLIVVKRDSNKTVTNIGSLALLVPCASAQADGEATFQMELGGPQPVRLFTLADARQMPRMKGQAGKHLYALLALRDALASQDGLDIGEAKKRLESIDQMRELQHGFRASTEDPERQKFGEAIAKLVGLSVDESLRHLEGLTPGPRAKRDAHRLLSYEVSRGLGSWGVRLVLWWDGKEFRPAIYCADFDSAFYAHTFLIAPMGGIGYRVCPHCSGQFLQDRPNQEYCKPAHREAHRVARFRDKKKLARATVTSNRRSVNGTQETR